jgi:cell wall-associated NlpC family hydrolase
MKKHLSFLFRFSSLSVAIVGLLLLAGPPVLLAETTHTVKPGESLYSIGKKYHVSTEEILTANPLSGETIQAGQKLVIPGGQSRKESPRVKKTSPSGGEAADAPQIPAVHKVKKGETLTSIAKKYGLEAGELKEINELGGQKLKAGQLIRLRPEEEEEFGMETQEEPPVFVQGNGFLLGEKSRELLGRVAKGFQGFRYAKGGGNVNGMDCSSYVQQVYKIFGIDLPRTAREQFRMGYAVARNALQVGDLVFFKRPKSREPTHVGIYLGESKYIHTSLTKRQVDIDTLDGRYANLHFVGAKRIEEVEARNDDPKAERE